PVGPSVTEDMALIAAEPAPSAASEPARAPDDDGGDAPLPAVDQLVKRIPAASLAVMDELFRARFTTVQRVPRQALKN
ncbi:MAG: hypothetical protein ACHQ4G_11255, partial [Opitutales bacterium]